MVDATPLARPMLAVLGEYCRSCVLVVNREEAPVWEMYQDEMREVETVTDPLRKADNRGTRAEDRIQNRVDEQAKRHFRRVASMIGQLLRADGYDVLVVGGHEYELADFLRLLPHELRGRIAGTFRADPAAPRWPGYAAAPRASCGATSASRTSGWSATFWSWPRRAGWPRRRAGLPVGGQHVRHRHAAATRRYDPGRGASVTSPAGWRPRGRLSGMRETHPVHPWTSWTNSRRPSSRPAARPGRSRRTSCQGVPDGGAASVPASTARGRAAEEGGRKRPSHEYRARWPKSSSSSRRT